MRSKHLTRMVVVLAVTALVVSMAATAASARGGGSSGGGGQIISVAGQSNSRPDLTVDIIVYVPAGHSASAAAAAALESQNARPVSPSYLGSDGFGLNGVVWPGGVATQAYNSANEPEWATTGGDLADAQGQWSGVPGSTFDVTDVGPTNDCPSLVRACPGRQFVDGENGVAWLSLKGDRNVLGVAFRDNSEPEVDIGLNLRFDWDQFPNKVAIAHATMLHEEGHLGGAGHSQTSSAVMFPFIDTVNPLLTLQDDDEEAMRFLYPVTTVEVSVHVQVDDGNGPVNTGDATVSLTGTGFTVSTIVNGIYTFDAVPNDVHYDVVATLDGDSDSDRVLVDEDPEVVNLTIVVANGDDGGPGFCPPGHQMQNRC